MNSTQVKKKPLPEFSLWDKAAGKRIPLMFELELTARCNNNCTHCYINLPAGDSQAANRELSFAEIEHLANQAVSMGALWCLVTGGEPLLRPDFSDIYTMLRKKGLLVSVFTNACLISEQHVQLFKKYPPREIEITVYGVTQTTYEKVSRTAGSFAAFSAGLKRLHTAGIPFRLKAMAMKSNQHELPRIAEYCRKYTMDYFRFDPLLHLRYDRNPRRNREILQERLSPEKIAEIEQADPDRSDALTRHCDDFVFDRSDHHGNRRIFHCGAGKNSFTVSPDGKFRLCSALWHPNFIYDLRTGSLKEAWEIFTPRVLQTTSENPEYLDRCRSCSIINLCLWCPANAFLETGSPDKWVDYFCQVAHARQAALKKD